MLGEDEDLLQEISIEMDPGRLPFASAFISAETVEASTDPEIRIRPPPANSISITPGVPGRPSPDAYTCSPEYWP